MFGVYYPGQSYPAQAGLEGAVGNPEIIDIIGSYQPVIDVEGSVQTMVDVAGSYQPTIDIAGEWGPGL